MTVAVIGAGSSGLAVTKALREQGLEVECFERRSDVGGNWCYDDSGLSAAYESLRANVSRARMQYPTFPMPDSFDEFPHHTDMAAYLRAYAERFGLLDRIAFGVGVERLDHEADGGWLVSLDNGSTRRYPAVVVATGLHWNPKLPDVPGSFSGESVHSHAYHSPEPFAGERVLVVGAGQSAVEIAVEVAKVAARTCISVRSATHVLPRWIRRRPYDADDHSPLNRVPWRVMNAFFGLSVRREHGDAAPGWPIPRRLVLEGNPAVSSDLFPAIRSGAIAIKPTIERLAGERIVFAGGDEEGFDRIVWATGYETTIPFLPPEVLSARGRDLPLYRRIVPPDLPGLFLAGFTDAPGGLLPVVEAQGEWIAAVLAGRLRLPSTERMWPAIDRAERRTRQRFPDDSPHSIRCDPHAYRRLLRSDLRRSRRCSRTRDTGEAWLTSLRPAISSARGTSPTPGTSSR